MAKNEFLSIEIQGVEGVSNWLIMSSKALYGATKHGVWEASKAIEQTTLSNISASPFKSDNLRLGVKHYFDPVDLAGTVDILGSDLYYDSYRLRFFEGGTKKRKTRYGNKGQIGSNYFFKNAILSNSSRAYQIVANTIYTKINQLNNG